MGYCVCDDEEYFYNFIDDLYVGLGAKVPAKDTVRVVQSKGSGYGISRCDRCLCLTGLSMHSNMRAIQVSHRVFCREAELEVAMRVAMETGVVLDPVYGGKAMCGLLSDIKSNPEKWQDSKILFIHTGGLLGMYDKMDQLLPLVKNLDRSRRMPL